MPCVKFSGAGDDEDGPFARSGCRMRGLTRAEYNAFKEHLSMLRWLRSVRREADTEGENDQ